jgi:hypothetical protein
MSAPLKSFAVRAIAILDSWLDRIPSCEVDGDTGRRRWYRHGCWGCRLQLARLSAVLDLRWDTGYWQPVSIHDLNDES